MTSKDVKTEEAKIETHKNGKTRTDIFRLIGYKGHPKRRGYWKSATIPLENHR